MTFAEKLDELESKLQRSAGPFGDPVKLTEAEAEIIKDALDLFRAVRKILKRDWSDDED